MLFEFACALHSYKEVTGKQFLLIPFVAEYKVVGTAATHVEERASLVATLNVGELTLV